MTAVRKKSLALTRFLMDASDELLAPEPFGFSVVTPRADESRGGHVALAHPEAMRISEALRARGVVPDFRPPDIVRIAPVALYNTHTELWRLVSHLREIVESREYEKFPMQRPPIS
ncbi:MAG: hypothetical protein SCM96_14760 [Acidobacteriota bacterium]|nr:hypothetical protein [Acidobacteriota bacterium]